MNPTIPVPMPHGLSYSHCRTCNMAKPVEGDRISLNAKLLRSERWMEEDVSAKKKPDIPWRRNTARNGLLALSPEKNTKSGKKGLFTFGSHLPRRGVKKPMWEQLSGKNKSETTTWKAIRYEYKFFFFNWFLWIIELKNVSVFSMPRLWTSTCWRVSSSFWEPGPQPSKPNNRSGAGGWRCTRGAGGLPQHKSTRGWSAFM